MSQRQSAPSVFDNDLRRLRRTRAHKRMTKQGVGASGFFTQRCADDAAERLMDINRRFERALIIGPADFWPALCGALPADKQPKQVTLAYDIDMPRGAAPFDIIARDDALPFEADSFDLIISCLSLHSVDDFPGALLNTAHILEPDGVMMAAVFGGDSLRELRASFYAAEQETRGQMSPRIYPMIDFSQSAQLLARAGLALPVVDTDRFAVNYKKLSTLVSDLRDLGDTNILMSRDKRPLSKTLWESLQHHYAQGFSSETGRYIASFEILWLTGWSPHARQQKPLKPGSAKMRLADALGSKEQKL